MTETAYSPERPRIGILILQGAVQDHFGHIEAAGGAVSLVRGQEDLDRLDGLIIPGGESTVTGRFLKEYGMIDPLRNLAVSGLPVWGVCAGAILLVREVDGRPGIGLDLLELKAHRNWYGRQRASEVKRVYAPGFLPPEGGGMPFIRAPRLSIPESSEATVFARLENDEPVGIAGGRHPDVIATAFHPELTEIIEFHRRFVEKAKAYRSRRR